MTLHPKNHWEVPQETARVARASFPKGNVYMKMYDELGTIYLDSDFKELFPARCGQSAISPAFLGLITVMQFGEGFLMLLRFQEKNLIKHRGKPRTDSTQILAAIAQVNRLELVGETLRAALNEIATVAPEWLKQIISDDWCERYSRRFDDYRLPKKKTEREQMAQQIGLDRHYLLAQIWLSNDEKLGLQHLGTVEVLRLVWLQQYTFINEQLIWRNPDFIGLPPNSICIESPYDIEARNSSKRGMNWTGYKVHFTETCDSKTPNLITNVETTPATTPDGEVTSTVHQKLADKNILPDEHFVDAAYVDSYQFVPSI